jgi:DNA-binding response OmpR family regulator
MSEKFLKVILMGNINIMKMRINELLKTLNVDILESDNKWDMLSDLKKNLTGVCSVILHINYESSTDLNIISKIRQVSKDVPIIFLTTNNKRDFLLEGLQKGISDYILIPFSDETILAKIKKMYRKQKK